MRRFNRHFSTRYNQTPRLLIKIIPEFWLVLRPGGTLFICDSNELRNPNQMPHEFWYLLLGFFGFYPRVATSGTCMEYLGSGINSTRTYCCNMYSLASSRWRRRRKAHLAKSGFPSGLRPATLNAQPPNPSITCLLVTTTGTAVVGRE